MSGEACEFDASDCEPRLMHVFECPDCDTVFAVDADEGGENDVSCPICSSVAANFLSPAFLHPVRREATT